MMIKIKRNAAFCEHQAPEESGILHVNSVPVWQQKHLLLLVMLFCRDLLSTHKNEQRCHFSEKATAADNFSQHQPKHPKTKKRALNKAMICFKIQHFITFEPNYQYNTCCEQSYSSPQTLNLVTFYISGC